MPDPALDTPAYHHPALRALRADLALALRAADHHGLGEGICNHFSLALPAALAGGADRFLINPQGLHWREVGADDIVLVDAQGQRLAGQAQWLAESSGRGLAPVAPALAARVAAQSAGERAQSELFFRALGRLLPER